MTYPFQKRVSLPTSHHLKSKTHPKFINHLLNGDLTDSPLFNNWISAVKDAQTWCHFQKKA
ncbi:hypothetical protein Golob_018637 [Gossypium lobatum]|uniref:Uncharacterized protein n=1 Tax=Gossypium lobatum TaxID=34289 RepID=A0A7J8MB73_9ROSI|nr:hypothetical protein [Gossypium lobatum]